MEVKVREKKSKERKGKKSALSQNDFKNLLQLMMERQPAEIKDGLLKQTVECFESGLPSVFFPRYFSRAVHTEHANLYAGATNSACH